MPTLTPAQVHAFQIKNHDFIEDPIDSCHECLICNAFVADLIDAWQVQQDNIRWFALNSKRAIIESKF